jgi:hypothetical protein
MVRTKKQSVTTKRVNEDEEKVVVVVEPTRMTRRRVQEKELPPRKGMSPPVEQQQQTSVAAQRHAAAAAMKEHATAPLITEDKRKLPPLLPLPTLDVIKHADLIRCCQRVGEKRGLSFVKQMQLADDLFKCLLCKKAAGKGAELTLSLPDLIDDAWHEFILNTDAYAHFAATTLDRFFPSHTTFTDDDTNEEKLIRIRQTISVGKALGFKFDSEFWNVVTILVEVPQPPPPHVFNVTVVSLTGDRIELVLPKGDATTIDQVKEEIRKARNYEVDAQRLIFAGVCIGGGKGEGSNTLKDYGILTKSTIHLVVRLRGC